MKLKNKAYMLISEFRTKYGYSNISYLAAGEIIEKITDTTWADYVTTHFLRPLKMNKTLTSTNQLYQIQLNMP